MVNEKFISYVLHLVDGIVIVMIADLIKSLIMLII